MFIWGLSGLYIIWRSCMGGFDTEDEVEDINDEMSSSTIRNDVLDMFDGDLDTFEMVDVTKEKQE